MPVTELQVLKKVQELAGAAISQVSVQVIEPSLVADALIADVVHDVAPILDACVNCMIVVGRRDGFQAIGYLPTGSKLALDLEECPQ